MTILPKKKVTKDRGENASSRNHGIQHNASNSQSSGSVQYGILTEASISPVLNQGNVDTTISSHSQNVAGPSRSRNIAGPPSPSSLLVQFNRSKKQKLYSENEDPESDDEAQFPASHPLQHTTASSSRNDEDGCNSDDERNVDPVLPQDEMIQKEIAFGNLLKEKRGFVIKQMKEDGACLFRSVADQVLGDEEMHDVVRRQCLDYMERNSDYFCQYVTEDFKRYISRKRSPTCHGNHIEIQAMSEVYNRRIEVYQYDIGTHPQENAPIRVSYHQKSHYNSVVDPFSATVGVGLGMPNLQPGLPETTLVSQALGESERDIIEKQMLEDKLTVSDWEATAEAIEQQIAQESYLEWLKQSDQRSKTTGDVDAPCTSSGLVQEKRIASPTVPASGHQILSQIQHLPPELFGLSDWDEEGDMLAQVLAASQAEYLESLKQKDGEKE